MAANIAKKGNLSSPLLIHNRTQKRADDLNAALGGSVRVAPTVAEAVAPADVVFTCVGDDAAILETFRAVVAAGVRGKLLVDCSTVHPDTTMELERMARDGGARFVAMPVFGAPAAADAGQLVCVIAGPKADVETVKPYTTGVCVPRSSLHTPSSHAAPHRMGKALIDLSDAPPSKALTLKLLGNTFVLSLIETLAEGHVLAEKCGLGTGPLDAFVQAMLPGPFAAYSTRMLSGDYHTRTEVCTVPARRPRDASADAAHSLSSRLTSHARTRGTRWTSQTRPVRRFASCPSWTRTLPS
jgi:3-hydroxyisobutyrate dehydrogenase-like beta-hydroxyacid dehydrogenase